MYRMNVPHAQQIDGTRTPVHQLSELSRPERLRIMVPHFGHAVSQSLAVAFRAWQLRCRSLWLD